MRTIPFFATLSAALIQAAAMAAYPPPQDLPQRPNFPDPLLMFDGAPVDTPADWHAKRKPELRDLFQHLMYGRLPAAPEKVTARKLFEDDAAFDGAGTLCEMELTLGGPGLPTIYLLVARPNSDKLVPCFVGANFSGNHQILDDPRIRLPAVWMPSRYPGVENNRATDAGRGQQPGPWPLAEIVRRGYAVATFHCGDVQPDRPDVREGLRASLPARDGADGAGTATVITWAWGLHRAVDYLQTDPAIDAARIAVVGHSRLGKAALVAAAFDERIALAIPNQAGCGGSAPSRQNNPEAESVARINKAFPHWFCENFKQFGDDPARLPFDQHALVALCAPRPVLFTAAQEDQWANPAGQFEVLKAATPVYELLSADGLKLEEMPAPDAPLAPSRLAFHLRKGKHAVTPADWQVFLNYADHWLR